MKMTRTLTIGSLLASLGFGAWYMSTGRTAADSVAVRAAPGTDAKALRTPQASPRPALPEFDPRVIKGWKLDTTSDEETEVDPERLADEDERDAMLAEDRLPEQAVWRSAWLSEEENEDWTRAISEEMRHDVEKQAKGDVSVRDVSCRETVCRFYLDLSDLDDAEALMAVERDPNLHYEFQPMNPGLEDVEPGEDANAEAKHHIEVLVAREDAFEEA